MLAENLLNTIINTEDTSTVRIIAQKMRILSTISRYKSSIIRSLSLLSKSENKLTDEEKETFNNEFISYLNDSDLIIDIDADMTKEEVELISQKLNIKHEILLQKETALEKLVFIDRIKTQLTDDQFDLIITYLKSILISNTLLTELNSTSDIGDVLNISQKLRISTSLLRYKNITFNLINTVLHIGDVLTNEENDTLNNEYISYLINDPIEINIDTETDENINIISQKLSVIIDNLSQKESALRALTLNDLSDLNLTQDQIDKYKTFFTSILL